MISNFFFVCHIVIVGRPIGNRGGNQALVGAIPFCGEYPGPWLKDNIRSANQMDGISKAEGDKMAAS